MKEGAWLLVALGLGACLLEEPEPATSTVEQHGMNMQGMNMQGMNMQGMNMQGMNMQGFMFDGATITNHNLDDVRVVKGEVIAERGGHTLRGTALVGARFFASVASTANPPVLTEAEYRITAIETESGSYDPTGSGNTFLYTLEQYRADTNAWVPACDADSDGRRVAIPLAATWNTLGARVESSTLFTFACTTGVIAKCYRWGYRPWLTGYGANMADMHQSCTRMARADYCGDGVPHTEDGTWINVWDRLSYPGPIQRHGLLPPLGMLFEAGWNTDGAVCLSHARWLLDDTLANLCPERLIPPGLLGATVCDTVVQVLGQDPNAKLFNESYLNLF
ncbi:MAG TPA: ADYC domain-containing protein [Kofleriaceae bacterium]